MVTLRSFRPSDIDSLYAISLATGHAGGDAWHLYIDGRLMGHIYVGPYAKFSPETMLVAEDEEGVGGYILGVFDTAAFEDRLEEDWWPGLRAIYPEPSGPSSQWNADERRCFMIHHLRHTPESLIQPYPAHVHMNLLPRLQQQGIGTALLDRWITMARQAGVSGIHLGTNTANHGASRFWPKRGFAQLSPPVAPLSETTVWFGRRL
ncbi:MULTISPECIES: GNAT family N-acetyltransferase [unclassified Rhizobium]|uniref:GNAT family N-acetyltransferase n=1 Tax=unclassified Rhizobium TaxID=2613769 RepID=UPI001ADABF32|nr:MULTISPECIES: GNAT family N-acetyltransferase [unclassified Rhizobium]MBO9098138.1 GNAT family N-acetyltransferase [Rhizobium sp. L58/93]MBO9168288.1 GNAT family N-acetyltransferase [Rhizobium sp. L245/93]MBO9184334.1 GNAT family N-acetyltransferase [Rhizobium sp. E27B/91]MBO9133080.1 GNAT family N-acetyltransferase [Rhizobium sp. B209b/85]QXZ84528.1 GNAT family N-acetyltransferase [Rhizobium sp. K1/93]